MARAAKRQKTSAPSANTNPITSRPDIRSFGKIAKVNVEAPSSKSSSAQIIPQDGIVDGNESHPNNTSDESFKVHQANSDNASKSKKGHGFNTPIPASTNKTRITPQKRQRNGISSTVCEAETPTKGARTILDAFKISSPSSKSSSRLFLELASSNEEQDCQLLPEPLQDLIRLHSSFLTSLSLHFAHHGCLAPVDLRECTPSIERTWGKRSVMLEDIRRILGVFNPSADRSKSSNPVLQLSDFGNGRICVELVETTFGVGVLARPINEQKLNTAFEGEIHRLWTNWLAQESNNVTNVTESTQSTDADFDIAIRFVDQLPLASVQLCSSVSKMAPLLSKGQRRLEEFKVGALEKKAKAVEAANRPNTQKGKSAVDRKQALLGRMRAKESVTSALPQPTQVEKDQVSAAQRLEEVVNVLDLLGGSADNSSITTLSSSVPMTKSSQRVSLPLPTLLQHLKNSMKNPISQEEGRRCIKLLAEKVSPHWVSMVSMGSVVGVVLRRGSRPDSRELKERIAQFT